MKANELRLLDARRSGTTAVAGMDAGRTRGPGATRSRPQRGNQVTSTPILATTPGSAPDGDLSNGDTLRLILVEDSLDDANLIARSLERAGYSVEMSRVDGEPALREALARDDYDLAMTDHEMDGFDSSAVLEVISQLATDLPCILVSGKVGEEAVSHAMRMGAAEYVAKDDLGRLPVAVARTLDDELSRRELGRAEEALARSGRLFEAVFLNARDSMVIVDDDRRILGANPAAARMLATTRETLMKDRVDVILPEAIRGSAATRWIEVIQAGGTRGEVELLRSDGSWVPAEYTVSTNFLPGSHIIVVRDISERRAAESEVRRRNGQQRAIAELGQLALREKRLDLLMDAAVARIAQTLDVDFACVFELRPEETALVVRAEVGQSQAPVGTRIPRRRASESQASFTLEQSRPVLVDDYDDEQRFKLAPILSELRIRSALSVAIPGMLHPFGVLAAGSGEPAAFDAQDANFLAAVANLVAEALERARGEEEIRIRSLQDPLTGLPNRTHFFDRLDLGLERVARRNGRLAVFFIDIDRFKRFNDTRGRQAADGLLASIGARIRQVFRETDTVARFGGDEFVVVREDFADAGELEAIADHLIAELDAPYSIDGELQTLSASVGIALSDATNRDPESLVRHADVAMARSKESGGAQWTLATEELRTAVSDRIETKRALEGAIDKGELLLNYQPIVALASGELSAVEALVRWEHPTRGLVPPGEFIPLAEESGLILRLGEWVLRAACLQAARWKRELGVSAPLPVHVNFSARQIAQASLPKLFRQILDETGVDPADIAVEITETALIAGRREPIAILEELRAMGTVIVLDDFGIGYSSLSYVDRFPIDTLKIDRSFVSPLENRAPPSPIVTAILAMARALAVGTVAEGVETAEQGAAVAALGCGHAQGYFFSRPTSAEATTRLAQDSVLRDRTAEALALLPRV